MDESSKLDTAKDWLRLNYQGNATGLRAKIDSIAQNGALDAVTITGDSYEGTSHSGQLTFEPLLYLRAAMDILRELAPELVPDAPIRGALTDFRTQVVGT